eukprot:1878633-Amphidinium_carterae.1
MSMYNLSQSTIHHLNLVLNMVKVTFFLLLQRPQPGRFSVDKHTAHNWVESPQLGLAPVGLQDKKGHRHQPPQSFPGTFRRELAVSQISARAAAQKLISLHGRTAQDQERCNTFTTGDFRYQSGLGLT